MSGSTAAGVDVARAVSRGAVADYYVFDDPRELALREAVLEAVDKDGVVTPLWTACTLVACRHSLQLASVVVLSYVLSYTAGMPVLNFRTDQRSEEALAELTADGSTTSEAIRQALVDAVKLRRREQMRAESRLLAADDQDVAESRRVLAEMDELRAW